MITQTKYEERRRELHQAARATNPPPFLPTPEGREASVAYGDFWARCAPLVDEVIIIAREAIDKLDENWASLALSERLREAIDKLDEEASK